MSGDRETPQEPPDADDGLAPLLRAADRGDEAALEQLLRQVSPAMVGAIRMMVPSADLDDITQEALLGLVRALPSFRFECGVKHFACRVAVRTATVALRARRRRVAAHERLEWEPPPSGIVSPIEDAALVQRQNAMRILLDALPEEQAETMALRVVLGCSLEEVAEATGAPINTVRSRMRLARNTLRARIETDPAFAVLAEGHARTRAEGAE